MRRFHTNYQKMGPLPLVCVLAGCAAAAADTTNSWSDTDFSSDDSAASVATTVTTSAGTSSSGSGASATGGTSSTSSSSMPEVTAATTTDATTTSSTSSTTTLGSTGDLTSSTGTTDTFGDTDPEICGDDIINNGEECDDANDDNSDACLDSCLLATCGDGFVQEGTEACDDANDKDDDLCLSTCELASCGDNLVHVGVEDCDDGNLVGADGCGPNCLVERLLFVTSEVFLGDLSSTNPNYMPPDAPNPLALADAHCAQFAIAAGLPGTYKAWLSTTDESATARLGLTMFAGEFVRTDGQTLAIGWDGLTSGMLANDVYINEYGDPILDFTETWTGTKADGTSSDSNCSGWESAMNSAQGDVGAATSSDSTWTKASTQSCNGERRFYCIQVTKG